MAWLTKLFAVVTIAIGSLGGLFTGHATTTPTNPLQLQQKTERQIQSNSKTTEVKAPAHTLTEIVVITPFHFSWVPIQSLPSNYIEPNFPSLDRSEVFAAEYDPKILNSSGRASLYTRYAKDSSNVYYLSKGSCDAGTWSIIKDADPASFIPLFDSQSGCKPAESFAKDVHHVYYNGTILTDADPQTFQVPHFMNSTADSGSYATDASHVFYKGTVVSGADVNSFTLVNKFLITDPPSGIVLDSPSADGRDEHSVYRQGVADKTLDPKTYIPHCQVIDISTQYVCDP